MPFLPSQYAAMRLGVHKSWTPPAPSPAASVVQTAPKSYGRIVDAPRVAGYNDVLGDCVPVMCLNIVQDRLASKGVLTPISNDLAPQIYGAVTGWRAGDPASDQGTVPEQMFEWWKQNPICGFKLIDATPIDPKASGLIKSAIAANGSVGAIFNLAVEQQNEVEWVALGTPGTWGRHAAAIDMYDGPFCATSWGEAKWISPTFFAAGFVDAVYRFDLEAT